MLIFKPSKIFYASTPEELDDIIEELNQLIQKAKDRKIVLLNKSIEITLYSFIGPVL